ncbi:hypothetical protein LEP1GSC083_5219 [Leptospira interrogans serovar Pyrogenes str. L0374]|uniref:Uncharacterized protein n=1 Tax=Leptospira interrogans serovar Pyrogenes str. L0374 TaxID=1049928 RepID=M6K1I5_LEPIR|nr:hypothetical protein LEP1GSC083_5219 [Leptospira interrogans serovar Pyrogenes str. L0374]
MQSINTTSTFRKTLEESVRNHPVLTFNLWLEKKNIKWKGKICFYGFVKNIL